MDILNSEPIAITFPEPMLTTHRVEAESMSLSGYRIELNPHASDGKVLSLKHGDSAETGTASYIFNGPTGNYDLQVGYFDENDGNAHMDVFIGTTKIDGWDLDGSFSSSADNFAAQTRIVGTGVELSSGDVIKFVGVENAGEHARLDYLNVKPVSLQSQPIGRIEAEDLNLANYRVESSETASGGKTLGLRDGDFAEEGTASYVFQGLTGKYDIKLGYYDENDGIGQIDVVLGGIESVPKTLMSWKLDKDLGANYATTSTFQERTVGTGVSLQLGQTIVIKSYEDQGEHARIDYLEILPAGTVSNSD